MNFTVLRFGSLYGSRAQKNNGLNRNFEIKAVNHKKIQYEASPVSQREYINVEDAALGSVEALKKQKYRNKYVIAYR